MIRIDDLLDFIISSDGIDKQEQNNIFNDSNFNIYMESLYDNLLSSLANKIRNDPGNYSELSKIKNIKKDISKESRKQYKIIISFCSESKKPNVEKALKQYNILHFLKLIIRLLDINEENDKKIYECKRYFGDATKLNLFKYLYNKNEATDIELKQLIDINSDYLVPYSSDNDMIIKRKEKDNIFYSLSPKAKNLYAFFMMKNINIDELGSNYSEGKVNEVLEYLIQYLLTQSENDRKQIEKPSLNSSSSKHNLNKLLYLLDKKDSYSQDFVQFSKDEVKSFNQKGDNLWKY